MSSRGAALDLRVRLLGDPCLWCWEIVDRRQGGVLVQSSWAGEWTAYTTQGEALSAGRERLAELQSAGAGHTGDRDRRKGASAT
jgi:hypothetical protein